jgi:hypothetical protein
LESKIESFREKFLIPPPSPNSSNRFTNIKEFKLAYEMGSVKRGDGLKITLKDSPSRALKFYGMQCVTEDEMDILGLEGEIIPISNDTLQEISLN